MQQTEIVKVKNQGGKLPHKDCPHNDKQSWHLTHFKYGSQNAMKGDIAKMASVNLLQYYRTQFRGVSYKAEVLYCIVEPFTSM